MGTDGNCQFAAVVNSIGMNLASNELRQLTADYLEEHRDEYTAAVAETHGCEVQEYATKLRADGTYGDRISLMAAATALKVDVWVLERRGKKYALSRVTQVREAQRAVVVAYQPYHYDAVKVPNHLAKWLLQDERGEIDLHKAREIATATGKTGMKRGATDVARKKPAAVLKLSTVNVASMHNRAPQVKDAQVDVMCVQETALTLAGQAEIDYYLREARAKMKALWGPPQPGRRKDGITSINIAQRGGVGIMVRQPRFIMESSLDTSDQEEWMRTRWLHGKLCVDGRQMWLHIITVYCPAGNGRAETDMREKFLQYILCKKVRELGNVPVVVAGDFNTDEARSEQLRKAIHVDKWVDAAKYTAAKENKEPPPTFIRENCAVTIDRILLNPIAASALVTTTTNKMVTGTDHMTVSADLEVARFKQCVKRIMIPKEIQVTGDAQKDTTDVLRGTDFWQLIDKGDVDGAFLRLSQSSEDMLMKHSSIANPAPHKGRGKVRKPMEKQISAPTTAGSCGAASTMQVRLEKLGRRITAARKQLESFETAAQLSGVTVNTLKNINAEIEHTALQCEKIPMTGTITPESLLTAMETIEEAVEQRSRAIVMEQRMERQRAYADATRRGEEAKTLTTLMKNGKRKEGTKAVKVGTETIADPEELDRTMREAWKKVFAKYENEPEPPYEPFRRKYGRHIVHWQMTKRKLTARCLRQTLERKARRSAAGTDGWRMSELRHLPDQILEGWAALLNHIEETGVWPKAMRLALVTLIPKCEDAGPLEHRPITVTSAVYRLWACTRLRDILAWQEKWIHRTQHGFRKGHGTEDALLDICFDIEEAVLDKKPLVGVALDFAKCFDSVPQQLVFRLMEDLGMDVDILRAMKGMYGTMERRFRYATGVGEVFTTTNGILQGCPLSVVMINALLAVLMKQVELETGAKTLSYADDAYLLATLASTLQHATNTVDDFCRIVKMMLHVKKTKVFAVSAKAPAVKVGGQTLGTTTTIEILGGRLKTQGTKQVSNKRVKAAMEWVRRLARTPLAFEQKANLIATVVLPSCLYDAAFSPPSEHYLKQLASEVTTCVWGPRYTTRSVPATLANVLAGHIHDPVMAAPYKAMGALYRRCGKDAEMNARVNALAVKYLCRGEQTPHGVVGNMLLRWLPQMGCTWPQLRGDLVHEPDSEAKRMFWHKVRDQLRRSRSKDLMEARRTMGGLGDGADPVTNKLWRSLKDQQLAGDLRRIIAGGVFYVSPKAWGVTRKVLPPPESDDDTTDEESEEGSTPQQRDETNGTTEVKRCDCCAAKVHEGDMLEHALWECEVAKVLQADEENKEVARMKQQMPRCLALHGTKPRGSTWSTATVEKVQWYLLEVVAKRDAILRTKWEETAFQTHQWEEIVEGQAWPTPKASTVMKHVKGDLLKKHAKQVVEWMAQLRWYQGARSTSITAIELAIDFEETTGVSLGGAVGNLDDAALKARRLYGMMKRLKQLWKEARAAGKVRGGELFPAEPVKRCHALRSIGVAAGIGWSRRACFVSRETAQRLEELGRRMKAIRLQKLRDRARAKVASLSQTKKNAEEEKAAKRQQTRMRRCQRKGRHR
eukprot:TRINITY_DN198_c0_g1_i7.p1 TRINITY_DN198_c0_g1~~TRINITY_DN198_c0_g1_i7.p1  ORF type:complete len:1582 (+),score=531.22 TRINITY_DN198_c0_g1_i7:1237-5982(+)